VYLKAFDEIIAPAVERFGPGWLLISAGFDAHCDDPITDLGLTAGDFAVLTTRAMSLVPPGRTIAMLEGGYDLDALNASTRAMLGVFSGAKVASQPTSAGGPGGSEVDAVKAVWDDLTARDD
jgi:acetoin utilization deacetylase AcuC-like enzyme